MQTIILQNDYHGTAVTLRSKEGWVSAHQMRRARKVLCGIRGCKCGGRAGERGPNPPLVLMPDGSAKIEY